MFSFRKNKTSELGSQLDPQRIPAHVAIIMDGNGRWAQKKHRPRLFGHKEGMETVKLITKHASQLGVKVLTLYAFSTENWKRPEDEVSYLMQLPVDFFDTFVPELVAENVQVNVMGYTDRLPKKTQKAAADAIADTKANTGMILNFALNYGGRSEIVTAVQKIAAQAVSGQLLPADINEETVDQALMTASLGQYADPDLLIRTSGEERISNFLLWQIAYSELVFTEKLWPDFDAAAFDAAIATYQSRDRRFGGLKK
ncbi:isoprenyl transferase [Loigolactobacillus backii]|uniref:Isoprenyl transferase n=1 Tax=Loigolactobacillus backii TaxID=375175 RepID=A0A192H333_9LACO|nr:isoprenyl transferase [Loigolactobacillus backii]ANK59660.1 isoprenyl transferase [Loigolactobacillus backii]ANK62775.1 isoprenyl transferase [Loigolactobacillus backii]ANK64654.1 isoprenyl transferase [Loigolactobacillus backii]ANK66950.1 isoprenyl transferase [Loigolactobacillus backii]ANK70217.1 isoprenyl transferase [Loigolactobacillus backii]